MKTYHLMYNVGKVKYLVNFHNGISKHKDGGNFFDIKSFKNKLKLNKFINDLINSGYIEKSFQYA
jgi:hypothetical protein